MAAVGPWWAGWPEKVMYAPSLAELMIVLGVLTLMGTYLAIWHWALSGPAATGEKPPQKLVETKFPSPQKPPASGTRVAA